MFNFFCDWPKFSAGSFGFMSNSLTYLHFFRAGRKFPQLLSFITFKAFLFTMSSCLAKNVAGFSIFHKYYRLVCSINIWGRTFTQIWSVSVSEGYHFPCYLAKILSWSLQFFISSPLTMNAVHAVVDGLICVLKQVAPGCYGVCCALPLCFVVSV